MTIYKVPEATLAPVIQYLQNKELPWAETNRILMPLLQEVQAQQQQQVATEEPDAD